MAEGAITESVDRRDAHEKPHVSPAKTAGREVSYKQRADHADRPLQTVNCARSARASRLCCHSEGRVRPKNLAWTLIRRCARGEILRCAQNDNEELTCDAAAKNESMPVWTKNLIPVAQVPSR